MSEAQARKQAINSLTKNWAFRSSWVSSSSPSKTVWGSKTFCFRNGQFQMIDKLRIKISHAFNSRSHQLRTIGTLPIKISRKWSCFRSLPLLAPIRLWARRNLRSLRLRKIFPTIKKRLLKLKIRITIWKLGIRKLLSIFQSQPGHF